MIGRSRSQELLNRAWAQHEFALADIASEASVHLPATGPIIEAAQNASRKDDHLCRVGACGRAMSHFSSLGMWLKVLDFLLPLGKEAVLSICHCLFSTLNAGPAARSQEAQSFKQVELSKDANSMTDTASHGALLHCHTFQTSAHACFAHSMIVFQPWLIFCPSTFTQSIRCFLSQARLTQKLYHWGAPVR